MDRQPGCVVLRRAILSVSDKTGVVDLARNLTAFGVELISTGGTYQVLSAAGLPVVEVSKFTGFPEILDGRVKTLHPLIHGGLLFRRDVPDHQAAAAAHGIKSIDLVVVNLYPFEKIADAPYVDVEELIENIDIGGPAMIRSAAKNHSHVAVVTDISQYGRLVTELQARNGAASPDFLRKLAAEAFACTARYDAIIHRKLAELAGGDRQFPEELHLHFQKQETLRYGENSHQKAALYKDAGFRGPSLVTARKLHGKELSYNNLLDLDSVYAAVREFARPAAVVVKHNNPCGAAESDSLIDAFRAAWAGDPTSAFGSVLGFNRVVDEATAAALVEPGRFVEAIVAPDFADRAVELLTTVPTWKNSVRLLAMEVPNGTKPADLQTSITSLPTLVRPIAGGALLQTADLGSGGFESATSVAKRDPTDAERRDLLFAWRLVKHVRSNAIVLAAHEAAVGVGAGQMSRVDACRLAIEKAGPRSIGSVLASDAFFPFRDNVDQAAAAGITAIIQPGGSKRDAESIAACNELGLAMLFTGVRRFKH